MYSRIHSFYRNIAAVLAALVLLGLFAVDADAQRRRRRVARTPRPVVTNPPIVPAGSEQDPDTGERIISTVDEEGNEIEPAETPIPKKVRTETKSSPSRTSRPNRRPSQMDEEERANLEMDRLTSAEQRTESLRVQLLDVETKLADLQPRLAMIEYNAKPENIERAAAGYGTIRPEEVRETRRRQLESERAGVLAQIRILEGSRTRLEAAIATADAQVDRLRRRIETREMQQDLSPSAAETRRPENPAPPE